MIAPTLVLFLQLSGAASGGSAPHQPVLSAVRYEHMLEMKAEGGTAKQARTRLASVFSGGNLRIDVLEMSGDAPGGPAAKGSYLLSRNDGKEQHMIDTLKREYYALHADSMLRQATGMADPMKELGLEISGVNVSVDEIGPGEVLLGHPTRHWKTRYQLTVSAEFLGDSVNLKADITDDSYYSHDVAIPANPLMRRDAFFVNPLGALVPGEESARVKAAYARLPKTAPLKSAARISFAFGPMEVTLISTDEITKIEQVNVPASFFDIPAGYKKVEPPVPDLPAKPPSQQRF